MPITTITHKGKNIVFISFEDYDTKEKMVQSTYDLRDYVLAQPEGHVLVLMDSTHAKGSREFMAAAKESRLEVRKTKNTSSAAIGISGVKMVLLKGYNAIVKSGATVPFNTKEEALDYLVSQV